MARLWIILYSLDSPTNAASVRQLTWVL